MSAARETAGKSLILSDFLPYRVVVLGHRISRRLAEAYASENISIPEWRVLAVISQQDAMAARDVVARTPLDKMAVSRAVATLEDKGLVERAPHPLDRRVSQLKLSDTGRVLFDRIAALALTYEEGLLGALEPEERDRFLSLLAKLEEAAREDMGDPVPEPA